MQVSILSAFNDNYIFMLQSATTPQHGAWVVDPGDAEVVQDWLSAQAVPLLGILITHHHWDHTDGAVPLAKHWQCPIWGPAESPFAALDRPLADGERFEILDSQWQVIATPGHTLDHLSYYTPGWLFCGDTLFRAGCGRMFEGTAEQFFQSLRRLAELPADTRVYCAHEYTLSNLRFAQAVSPTQPELTAQVAHCQRLREQGLPTIPSLLADECAFNPFLQATSAAEFARLRQWKDSF